MSRIPTSSNQRRSFPSIWLHLERRTEPCLTCAQVFRSRNRRRCWKFWTRSIRPNSVSRSTMCWIRNIQALSRSTFKSQSTMGYMPLKCCSASYKSGRCSRVEGGRYAPTIGVRVCPVNISQLTTFVPWKRMDSIPHPLGRSLVTRPMTPWYPPDLDWRAAEQVTS